MDPFKQPIKSANSKKPRNFAEALLELSNQKPLPQEGITREKSSENPQKVEHDWKTQLKSERHKEITQTQIYSQEQEELAKKIKEVQEELKALAKELAGIGSDIDKAINQAVVNPGKYHISFFESVRRFLQQLRKQASESNNWLAISQQRKASQNHYWGAVKKSGTSFMLSSERSVSTQSG